MALFLESFELSARDFKSCTGNKEDARYLYERSKLLLDVIKRRYPKYGEERFASYAAHPYRRKGRGAKGKWRDNSWVSFTDIGTLPGRKQEWVQLEAAIHASDFSAIIWIDWNSPHDTWQLVRRNIARNLETFKESLKALDEEYELFVYDDEENIISKFKCRDVTDKNVSALQNALANAAALWIGKEIKKDDAVSLGKGVLSFITTSFEEMTPTYLAMVGRGADAKSTLEERKRMWATGSGKKTVLLADISWNPDDWTRPYKNRNAPHRYVRKFPGHESLNFDFEKGGIDTPDYVYGFCQFARDPVDLADSATIFFYSYDYLKSKRGYIVGVYGGGKLIGKTEVPWAGFEDDKLSLNLQADRRLSFRFPVKLPSERYIDTRVGQVGFKYGTIEDAERILLDEYNACIKAGDLSRLQQLTTLYSTVTGKAFPMDVKPPVTIQKSAAGSKVEVEDETTTTDRQKLIDDAKNVVDSQDAGVVTTRPVVDTSGMYRPTSDYTGPITGNPHVKLELATKIGRRMSLRSKPFDGCPGGVVYVEEGYGGVCSDERLRNFSTRIRKIMEAIKGDSDGPNPDNIRIMVTHASTDAKLLPKDGLIGFNAVNDSESDAFWVMAAAREVAYLKRVKWYHHLRLMTELVVHAFGALDLAAQKDKSTSKNTS